MPPVQLKGRNFPFRRFRFHDNAFNFGFEFDFPLKVIRVDQSLGEQVVMCRNNGFDSQPLRSVNRLADIQVNAPSDRNKRHVRTIKFADEFYIGINGRVAEMINF